MQRRDFLISSVVLSAFFPTAQAELSPWSGDELIEPDTLARELTSKGRSRSIFCAGFPVLYRAAHIPGAILAGPCSKAQGLADLRRALAKVPRDREVVLYCGCCPFDKCPNIRPAFSAAHIMGFTNLNVLRLPSSLHTDWVAKGYPVQKDL